MPARNADISRRRCEGAARRTGVYRATPEELKVLDDAERSGIAGEQDVEAAFRSFRRRN